MNQEKQKVIRVLKPAKKTKKVSPIYYGIAGATLGIAITSVLIFSFIDKDSSTAAQQNVIEQHQQVDDDNEQTAVKTSNTAHSVQSLEEDGNEHDNLNIPQPRANEINGIFTHKNAKTVEPPKNDNPFGSMTNQNHTEKKPTLALNKPTLPTAPKSTIQPTVKVLNNPKPEQAKSKVVPTRLDEKMSAQVIDKSKTTAKEAEAETPNATVQISVTRSVKE